MPCALQVSAALRDATGVSASALRTLYAQHGDLGDVAAACKRKQAVLRAPPPLTLPGLMGALKGMARDSGQGSAGRRQQVRAREGVVGVRQGCGAQAAGEERASVCGGGQVSMRVNASSQRCGLAG